MDGNNRWSKKKSFSNELDNNGYITFNLNEFFEDPDFCNNLIKSGLKDIEGENISMSWSLPECFWEKILQSSKLTNIIQSYLGDDARLDDAYLKTIKDGLDSVSEGWHNDNVGYRLKLFIVFDVEGHPAPTILIPSKRPNLYKFSLKKELGRFFSDKKDKVFEENEIEIAYEKGSCLLFDTNLTHRGGFSKSNGVRHCIIVEFISKSKANYLSENSPCRPMQGKGKIPINAKDSIIKNSSLIDNKIINSEDNIFYYGQ